MATATFGAGCFWGVEAAFRRTPGVLSTAVGYAGGSLAKPTYEQVCSGRTGHVEVVQVEYDPEKVSYEQLLEVFWSNHDPTQLNRQGADIGTQYRSVIFTHDAEQRQIASGSKAELDNSARLRRPIVTEILPFSAFYRAEEYHQQYLEKRGLAQCALP
jgi:peptide-methionine (S)-S-oxide reductase